MSKKAHHPPTAVHFWKQVGIDPATSIFNFYIVWSPLISMWQFLIHIYIYFVAWFDKTEVVIKHMLIDVLNQYLNEQKYKQLTDNGFEEVYTTWKMEGRETHEKLQKSILHWNIKTEWSILISIKSCIKIKYLIYITYEHKLPILSFSMISFYR